MTVACPGRINVARSLIDGELKIGGATLHTPAYAAVDVTELWESPNYRGESLKIPGRPGRIALPKRQDETEYSVLMVIDGTVDYLGTAWGNARDGLRRNVARVKQIVGDDQATKTVKGVTLTAPNGSATLTGDAHCTVKVGAKVRGLWRAELLLTIPEGGLV